MYYCSSKNKFCDKILILGSQSQTLHIEKGAAVEMMKTSNDEIFWLFLKVLQILMAFHFNLMHDQVHWNRFHIEEIIFPFSNFFQCIAGFCTCRIVTEKFLWFQRPHYRLVPYIYQTGIHTKLGIKRWKLQITF